MGDEETRELGEEQEGTGESQIIEESEETTEGSEETIVKTEHVLEDGYIMYPDGTKIPVDRFEKVYRTGKEHERNYQETQEKLKLLQTSPEEYYNRYPDEKKTEATPDTPAKIGDIVIKSGEYAGMTLSDIYEFDPAEAQRLQFDYMTSQRESQEQARISRESLLEKTNSEIESFRQSRAKDFFSKDFSVLNTTEAKQIDTLLNDAINWAEKNKRGAGVIEDIYFLMHKDTLLSAEKSKGIKSLISGQAKSVPSIAGGGKADAGAETGYSRFLNMSDDQMAVAITDMPDAEYLKFKKEAPAELKRKHPGLPWN